MAENEIETLKRQLAERDAEIERLRTEIKDQDASFDLRWNSDMRAIKRWQTVHPGMDQVWPDHTDLSVWLLERLQQAERELEAERGRRDTGAGLITAERQRQVEVEGWTPAHDDQHTGGELLGAALSYAAHALDQVKWGISRRTTLPGMWPWNVEWWKPRTNPIRNLVKAGALIAAEIDRLRRAARKEGAEG